MSLIVSLLSIVLCFTNKSKFVGGFSIPKGTETPTLPKICLRFDTRLNAIAVEYTPGGKKNGNITDEIRVVKNNDDVGGCDDDDNGWDLREDWALQDAVKRYTVGTTMIPSEAPGATFWTQLRHSTPALATNTEKDLQERYSLLQQRQQQQLEKSSTNDIPKLIQSGSSPTLLLDWWVSSPSASSITSPTSMTSTTMMGGILESGSKICFPLECAGTIGDHPVPTPTTTASTGTIIASDIITQNTLDDFFTSYSMTLHTSSYAISIGGMVYELGKPQPQRQQEQQQQIIGESRDLNNNIGTRNSEGDHDNIIFINHLNKITKITASIVTKNAGMVLAVIAASTISACITLGYVTAIKTTTDYTNNNANQKQIVAITKSSSASSATRVTTNRGVTVPEYTVSEQRARQELRVGRDKRHMVQLQDRLERDEVKLTELREAESRLETE